MYETLNYVPDQVTSIYAASTQRTRTILYVVLGVAFAVLVYWLVVRYIGRNMSSGKPYVDNQTVPQNGTTTLPQTGSNSGGNTTTTTPEDPFLYANELSLKLTSTWLGICAAPDDVCYRLTKLATGGDAFLTSVGRAYSSSQGSKLPEAIGKNPCDCGKVGGWSWGRQTNYPVDKPALIRKLQAMGY